MKTIALRSTAGLLDEGVKAFYEENDPVLAKEAMGSQLKLIDALLKNEPKNTTLLAMGCEGYAGYSFLFLEDAQPERAKNLYLRSRDYGLRLLSQKAKFAGLQDADPAKAEAILKAADKSDVRALFWAAYGWSSWVNLSRDNPAAVADLPKTVLMMNRVLELEPGFYFSGADLFLGAYYASRPKMLGGDPKKAKEHFDAADKRNEGKFLMGSVLEAKYYAVAAQDQELFKKLLQGVQTSQAGVLPEARLDDEVAKQKAAVLLEKINDYF